MAEIVRATEEMTVQNVNLLIYGSPGIGKTSLGFTAGNVLLLDFDKGAHRSQFRGNTCVMNSWQDAVDLTRDESLKEFDVLAIDTGGRALDHAAHDIVKQNSKMGRPSGGLTLPGFGELKARFTNWVNTLNCLGKDLVFLCHDKEDRKGDDIIVRPDIQGGSYGELFKVSDGIGYMSKRGNATILDFSPRDDAVGKNPAQLSPLEVPDFAGSPEFLANIIAECKNGMGRVSDQAGFDSKVLAEFAGKIDEMKTVASANSALKYINAQHDLIAESTTKQLKVQLNRAIGPRSIAWDAEKKVFVKAATAKRKSAAK